MIESGLFENWKKMYETVNFCNDVKMTIKQTDKSNENILTLNHISISFYILLYCSLFSMVTFLFEIFLYFFKITLKLK